MEWKEAMHTPPHLHKLLEIIYVTEGALELGIGQEHYSVEKGDFAVVFPELIHQYRVSGARENKAVYLYLEPSLFPDYYAGLQKQCPKYPVIKRKRLHPDIVSAVKALLEREECNPMLVQAYLQMILAHIFSEMDMMEKGMAAGDDLIYGAVEYVTKNFHGEITLDKMAHDLCVSKYVLSRIFTKVFHCNFNRYVNGVRLDYAAFALETSKDSITNICLDCGFESQRTFNRVFKERYHMTPREYRCRANSLKNNILCEGVGLSNMCYTDAR